MVLKIRSVHPQVTGNVYAKDYASPTPDYIASTSNDMLAAYSDAAGRPNPTVFASSNLDGLTLAPGLYSSLADLNLSANSTLTLNGGPNDVWIIQVAGGLTTGATSNISLTGGALPQNVFWQIKTALTVGATSTFNGVVLTGTAVTIGVSSIIHGRLLAQSAITMHSNAITKPAP
ncbi:ice-binding family protein [Polynucleobacter sp. JS-JIR-II-c23]|uniref:ice-binding family protein n=1 Tax=Polynucleobacter sp. JS-JIR-II-c23 TaxID=1758393 RepID=UPI002B233D90|nr:ice-binding family protein [Polynucleobacter sp. JS-JIR-II-c23]MEA9603360.1 ice-binding family protein [Polynucleobacter sp. JS-JIR-II-c23]